MMIQYMAHTNTQLKKNVEPWITKLRKTSPSDILQIDNLYLVVALENGIMLIDQHATHERILYEQYLDAFKKEGQMEQFILKKPLVFELSLVDGEFLKNSLEGLRKVGFDIKVVKSSGNEKNGNNNELEMSFKLIAIPKLLKNRTDLIDLIQKIIFDL